MVNILPYYKIDKTEEGKQFFFDNIGYFNFWDEYLIMHSHYEGSTYWVLVNRTGRKFKGMQVTENQKLNAYATISKSVYLRKPKEMFNDFPELKKIRIRK